MGAFKDLTGVRFGKLVVLGKAGYKKNNTIVWTLQCDCGNIIERPGNYMACGDTQSCGCYNSSATAERCRTDITGQVFGRITVIGYDKTVDGKAYWLCSCSCGNITSVLGTNLRAGKSRSCGCINREIHTRRLVEMNYIHGKSQERGYINAISKKRKDEKRGLSGEWGWEMEYALRDFMPFCCVCGELEDLQTDHVFPLSKGYSLKPGNAVTLCAFHNNSKKAKMPEDLPDWFRIPLLEAAQAFSDHWYSL